ncbi:MAG: DNA repair protein RecO [Pseudomonadota bacterium]
MPAEPQAAYILHTRRFTEHSLTISVFTQYAGRMTVLAQGPRAGKARGLLQPFAPLFINWRGRGALPTLNLIESAAAPHVLTGRICYCGFYLNELIQHLTAVGDSQPVLFAHYTQSLADLQDADGTNAQLEPVLRQFEYHLLETLGIGLLLSHDCQGRPIMPDAWYDYHPLQGAEPAPAHATSAFRGEILIGLGNRLQPEQYREARRFMRQVLDYHLGGRPLRSRELFQTQAY